MLLVGNFIKPERKIAKNRLENEGDQASFIKRGIDWRSQEERVSLRSEALIDNKSERFKVSRQENLVTIVDASNKEAFDGGYGLMRL